MVFFEAGKICVYLQAVEQGNCGQCVQWSFLLAEVEREGILDGETDK
jgi:hypothetical protein